MSQRNDTEFWSTYKDRTEIPGKLKDILDIWKIRSPKNEDLTVVGSIVFEIYSWYLVGAGVKALNLEVLKKENETQELDQKLKRFKQELLKQLYSIRENSIDNIQVGYGS
jgi:hypothetical protein